MFLFLAENDIDVEYYRTMAERRRVALAEALEENEHLHSEVDSLKTEINALKAENSVLKPLADEAEYLAGVIKVPSFVIKFSNQILIEMFSLLFVGAFGIRRRRNHKRCHRCQHK